MAQFVQNRAFRQEWMMAKQCASVACVLSAHISPSFDSGAAQGPPSSEAAIAGPSKYAPKLTSSAFGLRVPAAHHRCLTERGTCRPRGLAGLFPMAQSQLILADVFLVLCGGLCLCRRLQFLAIAGT